MSPTEKLVIDWNIWPTLDSGLDTSDALQVHDAEEIDVWVLENGKKSYYMVRVTGESYHVNRGTLCWAASLSPGRPSVSRDTTHSAGRKRFSVSLTSGIEDIYSLDSHHQRVLYC